MVICVLTHISGRINAWFLIQIIDFQPGIIRQHDLACQLADSGSFDHSIFLEGFAVLYNVRLDSCFFHGQNFRIQIT